MGQSPGAHVDGLGQGHLLLAWLSNAADQENVVRSGFGGAVRQDPGDYLYPVDSNVAPATKLNAWTARSLDLNVQIDTVGNARNTLAVTWEDRVNMPDGNPYRAMSERRGQDSRDVLSPPGTRAKPRRRGLPGEASRPSQTRQWSRTEAGRMAIGTYLEVPPGAARLQYTWTSPYAADADTKGGTYASQSRSSLARSPGPLTLTIQSAERLPDHGRKPRAHGERGEGDDDGDLRSGHCDRRDIRTLTPDSRVRDAVLHRCFQCSLAELEIRHVRTPMARVRKAFRPVPVRHMGRPRRRRAFPVPHRSRSRTRRARSASRSYPPSSSRWWRITATARAAPRPGAHWMEATTLARLARRQASASM